MYGIGWKWALYVWIDGLRKLQAIGTRDECMAIVCSARAARRLRGQGATEWQLVQVPPCH